MEPFQLTRVLVNPISDNWGSTVHTNVYVQDHSLQSLKSVSILFLSGVLLEFDLEIKFHTVQ